MGQTESHLKVPLKVAGGTLKTNAEHFVADGLPFNQQKKKILDKSLSRSNMTLLLSSLYLCKKSVVSFKN